ncbi:MAG TPA: aminotransferase class I/II-fold pyridoxal phosphate-dependent enzyme [Silvibacterium sp.]|nr:aminotransferase class I/II-fold pyridoxal phosphate-dependent enzyme [Silvibacterium sp.]
MTRKTEIHLAKRLDEVGFSDIVQIRNKVLELRSSGQTVHTFHGGEPYFDTPEPIKYAMMKALVENKTRYAPSSGIEPLRVALAKKLREKNQIEADPEEVIVTAGGAHALHVAFQAVLNPGDDVLIFSPFWTPIRDMVTETEARALLVPTATARRIGLTATLEQFSTSHTRAIYYNTPQNPAGTVFTRAEAEEVAAFAKKHNLIVIADEAYEDLVYEGEHVSIASLPGMFERTISTFTFSKSYAMTGWRIGYAVAREPFMTGLRKLVLYSINGVSTPTQWAALEALNTTQSAIDARRAQYRAKRDLLVAGLCECGLQCDVPEGAFYAFPDVTKIHKDSRKVATILLDKAHVATVPGVVFGAQGEGHVRFGYSMSTEAISAGLAALKSYFANSTAKR